MTDKIKAFFHSKEKVRLILSLAFCAYLFLSTLIVSVIGIIYGAGQGQLGLDIKGINYFKPYTIDSNILVGVASFILFFSILNLLREKKDTIKSWVFILYFVTAVSIMITFLVVLFFLGPVAASQSGFAGFVCFYTYDMAFFHLINPLVCLITFLLIPHPHKLSWKTCFFAVIPVMLYSFVYVGCVCTNTWSDFYGFTFGGKLYLSPVVMLVMYVFAYGLAFLISLLSNGIKSRKKYE